MVNPLINLDFFGANISRIRPVKFNLENLCKRYDLIQSSCKIIKDPHAGSVPTSRDKLAVFQTKTGKKIKVKIFTDDLQAKRSFLGNSLAYLNKVPVATPIGLEKNFALFSFIEGDYSLDYISKEQTRSLGIAHATMNSIYCSTDFDFSIVVNNLLGGCIRTLQDKGLLEERIVKDLNRINHPFFIPVLDHDDLGVHNIVRKANFVYIIDEEGFGIIPFGFGLVRSLYDKVFKVCRSQSERDVYLGQFPDFLKNYFEYNAPYFMLLYVLRNAARKISSSEDIKGASVLVEKARTLIKKI